MKTNEKIYQIENSTNELDGIAAVLLCIATSLTAREGAPSSETIEAALLATADHIRRVSSETAGNADEIIHSSRYFRSEQEAAAYKRELEAQA